MASSCIISSEPPWTNTNSMWITGGMHHVKDAPLGKSLASTEIVTFQSGDESQIVVTPGPDLPVHVWGHCIVIACSCAKAKIFLFKMMPGKLIRPLVDHFIKVFIFPSQNNNPKRIKTLVFWSYFCHGI